MPSFLVKSVSLCKPRLTSKLYIKALKKYMTKTDVHMTKYLPRQHKTKRDKTQHHTMLPIYCACSEKKFIRHFKSIRVISEEGK